MTCHVAISSAAGSVLFSDSQASTSTSETHGVQKQIIGKDFLLGGAGNFQIVADIFETISRNKNVTESTLQSEVLDAVNSRVRESVIGEMTLIALTPSVLGLSQDVQVYRPALFRQFGKRTDRAWIGSGSEFVQRRSAEQKRLGIHADLPTIVDLLIEAYTLQTAANESLTVNEHYMISLLIQGKTYVLASDVINARFKPERLKAAPDWRECTNVYKRILKRIETLISEYEQTLRYFSSVRLGELSLENRFNIQDGCAAIKHQREMLEKEITKYRQWYDGAA